LLLRYASRDEGVSAVVLAAVLAAVAAGSIVGVRRPRFAVVGGLLMVAAGAAGTWVLPSPTALLVLPVAWLAFGSAAALLGGLQFGLVSPLGVRLVGAAAISAALLGALLSLPLGWALGGALPDSTAHVSADARVFLGLTFAAAVLCAGYTATLISNLAAPDRPD
jgi:hypothetical protein